MAEAEGDPDVVGLALLGSRSVGDRGTMHARRSSMVKLIYAVITSLDGYITAENGSIEWTAPDEEVIACVNALERPIGTHLYGRRVY
jgi:hypothetical protein